MMESCFVKSNKNHPLSLLSKEGSVPNSKNIADNSVTKRKNKPEIIKETMRAKLPSFFQGGAGVVFSLVIFLFSFSTSAQSKDEQYAAEILNKAMGPVGNEEGNMAIYFEGVAYRISQPKEIFNLPAYQVLRGGFMINDGRKFEIQLGLMKALCDGKIMVIIDEQSKSMIVDSIRNSIPGFENEIPDIQKLMKENFGEGTLKYEGKEIVHGKACHKIKAIFPEDPTMHVLYWVDEKTNKLLLMADYQSEAYDVYWVSKVTTAPKSHVYNVNIPKRELEKLYGYEVHDLRYAGSDRIDE